MLSGTDAINSNSIENPSFIGVSLEAAIANISAAIFLDRGIEAMLKASNSSISFHTSS